MATHATTWALAGGIVLAVGAAVVLGNRDAATPTPDDAVVETPPPPVDPGADGRGTPGAMTPPDTPASEGGPPAPARPTLGGKVAEVIHVESYTYVRLDNGVWAAVPKTELAEGDMVHLADATLMRDFASKTLGRTFETIYFGRLANAAEKGGTPASPAGAAPVPSVDEGAPAPTGPPVEGTLKVAELYARAPELAGRRVTFEGRITKVTANVLGKTWLHVEDGSGDADAGTNDMVVTTLATPNVGDQATITGTLSRDEDVGAGYRFDVLIKDATVTLLTN
ncbi:MAG: DNA-binding protein [Myxococcota bacterium]